MNKTLKKTLSIILTILMIVTAVPLAFAADIVASGECGADGDNLTWTLDTDGTLTISGTGVMAEYSNINLPDYGRNLSPWAGYKENIKKIVIEEGVTELGLYAFYEHTAVKYVSIADTVTTFNGRVFDGCSAIESLLIPASVSILENTSFQDCSSLKKIVFLGKVDLDSYYAFNGCSELREIVFAKGATNNNAIECPFSYTDINVAEVVIHFGGTQDEAEAAFAPIKEWDKIYSVATIHYIDGCNCSVCGEYHIFDDGKCVVCDYDECLHESFTDGKCSVCGYCPHENYTDGKCDACGYKCPHKSITDSKCEVCGCECPHESYTDGKCDACGYECAHESYADSKCEVCGYGCPHESYTDGKCDVCGYECPHESYTDGKCSVCDYEYESIADGVMTTLDVSKGNIVIADRYVTLGSETVKVDPDGYIITGTAGGDTLLKFINNSEEPKTFDLVFDNLSITADDWCSVMAIEDNSPVTLNIVCEGSNAVSSYNHPVFNNKEAITSITINITKTEGSSLTFERQYKPEDGIVFTKDDTKTFVYINGNQVDAAGQCYVHKNTDGIQYCKGYLCEICGQYFGEKDETKHYSDGVQTCCGYKCKLCGSWYGEANGEHIDEDFDNLCDIGNTFIGEEEIKVGDTYVVNTEVYVKFVPTISGTYVLSSSGDCDPYVDLYDSDFEYITYADDDDYGLNFSFVYDYTAGETYYFHFRDYDGEYDYSVSFECKEHQGGEANCTDKAVCEVCGVAYGDIDADNHDWSNKDGICANACGYECPHASYTDGVCDNCGYECPHNWGEGVLTRPTIVNNDGALVWKEGYYTYTCELCGDENTEAVEKANISLCDELLNQVLNYRTDDTLTDEAKAEIDQSYLSFMNNNSEIIDDIGFIRIDLVADEQGLVDKAAAELQEIIAAIEAKITSGEYVKADYTEIDEAIKAIDEALEDATINDEMKAELEDIKADLEALKENVDATQADVADELADLLDRAEEIAETMNNCANGVHSFTKYEETEAAACEKAGKKVASCDHGCGATDEEDIPAYEHIFVEYISNGDATCEADGTKTAKCIYACGAEDTITDEGSQLDHADEDGDKICDDCQAEIIDTCPDCGRPVHEGQINEYICLLITLIKLVVSLVKALVAVA